LTAPGRGPPWRRSGSTPDPCGNGRAPRPGAGGAGRARASRWPKGSSTDPFTASCGSTATGLRRVERDTQLRLLAAALQWVGGAEYRPRAAPLEALLDRALAGGGGTLHGAQVEVTRGRDRGVSRVRGRRRGRRCPRARPRFGTDGGGSRAEIEGIDRSCAGRRGVGAASRPEARHAASRDRPHPAQRSSMGRHWSAVRACATVQAFAELHMPQGHFLALLNPH
jgi:hypothetical protein